jgi:hypothetical protein
MDVHYSYGKLRPDLPPRSKSAPPLGQPDEDAHLSPDAPSTVDFDPEIALQDNFFPLPGQQYEEAQLAGTEASSTVNLDRESNFVSEAADDPFRWISEQHANKPVAYIQQSAREIPLPTYPNNMPTFKLPICRSQPLAMASSRCQHRLVAYQPPWRPVVDLAYCPSGLHNSPTPTKSQESLLSYVVVSVP